MHGSTYSDVQPNSVIVTNYSLTNKLLLYNCTVKTGLQNFLNCILFIGDELYMAILSCFILLSKGNVPYESGYTLVSL
jgi:hypothetical protein